MRRGTIKPVPIKLNSDQEKTDVSANKSGTEEVSDTLSGAKNYLGKKLRKWGAVAAAVTTALAAIGYLTSKPTERDTEVTGRTDIEPQKLDNNAPAALREELRHEAELLNKKEKEKKNENKSSALPPTQQFAEVSASVDSPYEARQVVTPTVVTAPPRPGGMG